jgi:hypothetical protein
MVYRRLFVPLAVCCFVASPLFAITRAWTGAASANWSDPANWTPAAIPATADSLTFPAGAAHLAMTNDLPAGTSVGAMTFNDNYTLSGNALTLNGDLAFLKGANGFANVLVTFNADLKLANAVTFGSAANRYNGAIDINGQTLTLDESSTINSAAELNGPLNGSGTVTIIGAGVYIAGTGTFNGTINGAMNVGGSLPNATVNGRLSGVGTVGNATVTAAFSPGDESPWMTSGFDIHPGVLHTKALVLNGPSRFDLLSAGGSDQVQVTGTVAIGGSLIIDILSGAVSTGQTFTIIDNDGVDPVTGTFTGLSEGATLAAGSTNFTISYHGGNGNDVVLTSVSTQKTWTGNANTVWSNAQNWTPQAVPAAGEELLFPTGVFPTMTNDLPAGTSVGAMTFNDNYTLSGNALTLTGDLSFRKSNGWAAVSVTFNTDLKLGKAITFGSAANQYNGAIDVNGQALTIDETSTLNAATDLNGPLNGSGAITITGQGAYINGVGTFSGTITGSISVSGSLPNATVSGRLSGTGIVGNATAAAFSPGDESPWLGFGFDKHAGVLRTKSLALTSGARFDLQPGSISDQVQVTGAVTLTGALIVDILTGAPAAGQTFILINNDGTDPVSGTFDGLPEGSTIAVGSSTFVLSYRGGDGNDVALTAASTQKAWTGSVSSSWSDPHNWSPQAVPASGEVLLFPAGARLNMTNDLPANTLAGAMTFNDNYTLSGNSLMLNGDLAFLREANGYASVQVTFNTDMKLATAVVFGSAPNNYNGAIDVNGQTLTIDESHTANETAFVNGPLNGSGTVTITGQGVYFKGTGTFSGTITGPMNVSGSLPNATVNGHLSGVGTVGNATATSPFSPGDESPWKTFGFDRAAGVLHTKSLALTAGARFDLYPGATSDQVQVTGTVSLGGPLTAGILAGAPAVGQAITIIDNDGTDPVGGTFSGMPERAVVALAGQVLRISYQGGDGNDVVLFVLADTTSVLSQNASDTKVGESWILTATVSSASGVPTGSVSFSADGVSLGTAAVINGVATLTIAPASAGTRNVTATFAGTGIFADSVSAVLSHVVSRGKTKTEIASDHQSSTYGDVVHFTAAVTVLAPAAGQPGGSVTILADGSAIGTVPLVNGTATFETASLHGGPRSITATYSGDANFEGSTAPAFPQSITRAATRIDVQTHAVLIGASPSIKITVNVPGRPDLVPSGTASIGDNTQVFDTASIVNGAVTFTLAPMPAGDHNLFVTFSGDGDFAASSATLTQTVTLPSISAAGTHIFEGDHGVTTATVVITLSAPVFVPVRVSFATVAGSAAEGEDYEKASGVVEFAPGQVTRAIELHIVGDTFPEGPESFTLLLFDPLNATIDTPSASVVIVNDDQVPPRHRPSRH